MAWQPGEEVWRGTLGKGMVWQPGERKTAHRRVSGSKTETQCPTAGIWGHSQGHWGSYPGVHLSMGNTERRRRLNWSGQLPASFIKTSGCLFRRPELSHRTLELLRKASAIKTSVKTVIRCQ